MSATTIDPTAIKIASPSSPTASLTFRRATSGVGSTGVVGSDI